MSDIDLNLIINGETLSLKAEADTPLLWILRDHLNLKGTKFGCGMAQCGACTVVVDGNAIRSCVMPVEHVQGKRITTIEGLDAGHPIKQAWTEVQVPQCGYCQSGQMMSAYSLLNNKLDASEEDIKAFMAGNICRCGTYPKIMQAIGQAQSEIQAKFQKAEENTQQGVQFFDPSAQAQGDIA